MKKHMEERTLSLASFIIEHKCTVRDAAKHFDVSKSTVHKDVAERLWELDRTMANKVKKILSINKADRHIRGGKATKRKYEKLKSAHTKGKN